MPNVANQDKANLTKSQISIVAVKINKSVTFFKWNVHIMQRNWKGFLHIKIMI